MHPSRPAIASAVLLAGTFVSTGCSTVRSTSVATAAPTGQTVSAEQVQVGATYVPPGATQVAIVETHGNCNEGMEALIAGFRSEVARTGGDFGKIDTMRTEFEMVRQQQTQSYSCGTTQAPRTCTRQVYTSVEVGVTTLVGRSFRTGALP